MCLPTYLLACLHVPHLHNKAMLQFHCRICHSHSNCEMWNLTTLKNIFLDTKRFLRISEMLYNLFFGILKSYTARTKETKIRKMNVEQKSWRQVESNHSVSRPQRNSLIEVLDSWPRCITEKRVIITITLLRHSS